MENSPVLVLGADVDGFVKVSIVGLDGEMIPINLNRSQAETDAWCNAVIAAGGSVGQLMRFELSVDPKIR